MYENFPNPSPWLSSPRISASLGIRPHSRGWRHSVPSGYLFSPVSGSLKSGKVIVLSCRLSAMVLSKRLLPRPESLQNTATNVSHLKGGREGNRINQYRPLECILVSFGTFSFMTRPPASRLGLGWESFQHLVSQTRLTPHPQTCANFSLLCHYKI